MISPFPASIDLLGGLARQALQAVDPARLLLERVKRDGRRLIIDETVIELDNYRSLHLIAVGKGAPALTEGLLEVLGPNEIAGGLVVSLTEHQFSDQRVSFLSAAHPVPDRSSLAAGEAVYDYARARVDKSDLVFFLLTGGASALLVKPWPGISLAEKMEMNSLLLASGADINAVNCVRKHISAIKGGRLAELIAPARLISLVVSDIIDSPLEAIGSAPQYGDSTTFTEALAILEKFGLLEKAPPSVLEHLRRGAAGLEPETPRPDSEVFRENRHFIIGDVLVALDKLEQAARSAGREIRILSACDQGEASEAARFYAGMLKEIIRRGRPFKPPVLLAAGGELTVTVRGRGRGGRNQEFILQLLREMAGISQPFQALSLGTDGIDGPTDAAGAWIDEKSLGRSRRLGLDLDAHLAANDSYSFFKALDQLLITGPTRTNVMDLRLFQVNG